MTDPNPIALLEEARGKLEELAAPADRLTAETRVAEAGDEARSFGPERLGQHLARALEGDLGQRIEHRSRLAKRGDRGIVLHDVSLLREVLAGFDTRHDTPPSQSPSPIFGHSSAVQGRSQASAGRDDACRGCVRRPRADCRPPRRRGDHRPKARFRERRRAAFLPGIGWRRSCCMRCKRCSLTQAMSGSSPIWRSRTVARPGAPQTSGRPSSTLWAWVMTGWISCRRRPVRRSAGCTTP